MRITSERSTSWVNAVVIAAGSVPQTAAAAAASNDPANTERSAKVGRRSSSSSSYDHDTAAPKRTVPRRRAVPGREQREAVVEPGRHLGDVVGVQAGGGQLDRQRQPVEAAHDLGDQRPLGGVGSEAGRDGARPLDEQLDRRTLPVVGQRQRRHHVDVLAGEPEPFPARGHHAHVRARRQHALGQRGHGVEHVLAVVEQQHEVAVAHHVRDPPDQRRPGTGVDAERRGHDVDRGVDVGGRQLAEHDRPSGSPACSRRPISSCRRVLPTPPGPTNVTSRPAPTADSSSARSSSRPISDVAGTGNGVAPRRSDVGTVESSSSACAAARAADGSMPSSVARAATEVVVHPQRLGPPSRRTQRGHQQLARSFPQRVLVGQRRQLGDESLGVATCEPMLGDDLVRPRPQLVEVGLLGSRLVDVGELGERRAVPPPQQFRDIGVGGAVRDRPREVIEVHIDAGRVEAVAVVDGIDRHSRYGTPQTGHVVLERGHGIGRAIRRPHGLGGGVDGDHPAAPQHEQRQQPTLQRAGRRDVTVGRVEHPDRPEHIDP